MSAKALKSNKVAVQLFPQDSRGARQVAAIERAIRETLAFLKTKEGLALVKAAPEAAKVSGSEVVAIAPDLHFHWADPACVSLFLLAVATGRPNRIVLLGDVIEAGAFSSHKRKTISEETGGYIDAEIYTARLFMDALQELAPDALLVMLGGNHCARVEASAALLPGGLGEALLAGCNPYTLLARHVDGTERQNFRVIPYQKALSHYAITPNLWAIHGWFCGVNFCMDTLRKCAPISMVMGHAHRQQSVSIRNPVDNTVRMAWSPGTLSLLQPLWNAPNPTDWVQGFSFVYVGADQKHWSDYTITILEHACVMPGGTQLKAVGCAPPRNPSESQSYATVSTKEFTEKVSARSGARQRIDTLKKKAVKAMEKAKETPKRGAQKKAKAADWPTYQDYLEARTATAAAQKAKKAVPGWAKEVFLACQKVNKADWADRKAKARKG